MTKARVARAPRRGASNTADPHWYRHAVFYELLVRGFADGNGDGVGDLQGLIGKLDYLQWLGIDCIWLLPFNQSPLRDGGYDISDYYAIQPEYGTVDDLRQLIEEAHRRDMRVIMDLVMNHTSDQHPWFQEARSSRDSPKRDWYVWSDTPERYSDARIIFIDTESSNWTWDEQAGAYYWHRFFSHQPDLNYDNPEVRAEILNVIRFWLDLGMDGFRLDAVPYLFEREGTNCENLPETHEFLATLREIVDREYGGDKVLLAEANQWPEDVVDYFGTEERPECHMCFHFPLMPRMFMALRREQRYPITEILERTPAHPVDGSVGHLPAQPRRADPRDGHRGRARLHVGRVRARPAHEAQPRHPAPPGAAAQQRPPPDGAVLRAAAVAARHPHPLLRRRDRDGRQHLPRRSRRRAHPDAVDRRPQRRLLQAPTSPSSTCRR